MTRHERRCVDIRAKLRPEDAHHREAHRHERGLGVLGQGQILVRPIAHQPVEMSAMAIGTRAAGDFSARSAPMPTDWLP